MQQATSQKEREEKDAAVVSGSFHDELPLAAAKLKYKCTHKYPESWELSCELNCEWTVVTSITI